MRLSVILSCGLVSALGAADVSAAEGPASFGVTPVRREATGQRRAHFDVYAWQRAGSAESAADVARFVAESDGRVHVVAVDDDFTALDQRLTGALASAHAPTILTFRFTTLPKASVAAQRIADVAAAFVGAGVDLVGVEVDHDCATRALPDYARWLSALQRPPAPALPTVPVSITALPTWLDDDAHVAVFAAVADVTIQVHAIAVPALFDVDAALEAMDKAPAARVALPTYAVTLRQGPALFSQVTDVAAVRAHAERVTYFRMPTHDDTAAWSWPTLLAVDGAPAVVAASAGVASVVAADDGAFDVVVENVGATDAPLAAVSVAGADAYDVVGDVIALRVDGAVVFVAKNARYLRPKERQTLAWVRSPAGEHTHGQAPRAVVVDDPRSAPPPRAPGREPAPGPERLQPEKLSLRPVLP
jgi:hypothetical protein